MSGFIRVTGFERHPEGRMQFLLLVAAVLISVATALASAEAILSLMFHLMSRLR